MIDLASLILLLIEISIIFTFFNVIIVYFMVRFGVRSMIAVVGGSMVFLGFIILLRLFWLSRIDLIAVVMFWIGVLYVSGCLFSKSRLFTDVSIGISGACFIIFSFSKYLSNLGLISSDTPIFVSISFFLIVFGVSVLYEYWKRRV